MGDAATRIAGQALQFGDDGLGRIACILAVKPAGQRQPGGALMQGEQDVALAPEVHEITLPMTELASLCNAFRALTDRHTIRNGRLPLAVAHPTASF
jgi:hypothetical protein